jgi:regulator of sigma E protease
MLDEREGEVLPYELHRAFNRKPVLQRMAIVVAGPVANLLLAIVLYWILFMHGVPGLKPVLGDVPQGTPAALAQLHQGDVIVSINDEAIPSWQELRWTMMTLALKNGDVKIESRAISGITQSHMLNISGLEARDLDGEFLDKLGLRLAQPLIAPVIGKLVEGGVAQQAGIQEGDVVLRADGLPVSDWGMLVNVVRAHPGKSLQLDIQRATSQLRFSVIPQSVVEADPKNAGARQATGRIGAAPRIDQAQMQARLVEVSYGPWAALSRSLNKTLDTAVISLKMLAKMLLGEVSVKNLSGPITIADYAGQSAQMGLAAYLGFLALISISLGVLNLLPVPLLDGGHLLYYVAELLKGSPVSEQAWETGQKIGIALLGTLMVFAIYNDINRLISG